MQNVFGPLFFCAMRLLTTLQECTSIVMGEIIFVQSAANRLPKTSWISVKRRLLHTCRYRFTAYSWPSSYSSSAAICYQRFAASLMWPLQAYSGKVLALSNLASCLITTPICRSHAKWDSHAYLILISAVAETKTSLPLRYLKSHKAYVMLILTDVMVWGLSHCWSLSNAWTRVYA